jgi:hypothetical protein
MKDFIIILLSPIIAQLHKCMLDNMGFRFIWILDSHLKWNTVEYRLSELISAKCGSDNWIKFLSMKRHL